MPRLPLLLAALVAATIALPSVAQGATLERYDGIPGTMLLTGAPAETNLISVEDRPGSVVITDNAGPLKLKDAFGCLRLDSNSASCFLASSTGCRLLRNARLKPRSKRPSIFCSMLRRTLIFRDRGA